MRKREALLVLAMGVLVHPRKTEPAGGVWLSVSSVKAPPVPVAGMVDPSLWVPPGVVCAGQLKLPHGGVNWKEGWRLMGAFARPMERFAGRKDGVWLVETVA